MSLFTASRPLTTVATSLFLLVSTSALTAQCPPTWLEGNGFDLRGSTSPWVSALAVMPNGDLVAAGTFTMAGGQPIASSVARWNGATWSAVGSLSGATRLAVKSDGTLIAGGTFPGLVATWNGTAWSPLGGGIPNGGGFFTVSLDALCVLGNGDVVAGGRFGPLGCVARWNGSAWSGMDVGAFPFVTEAVSALGVSNGALFAGTRPTGLFANGRVLQWNGTTWSWVGAAVAPLLMGISALAVLPNGSLVAGGGFQSMSGVPASGFARWDGSAWSAFGDGIITNPAALAMANGVLYAAGSGGLVASWNGTTWSTLGTCDRTPWALAMLGTGDLVAGGDFARVASTSATALARYGCAANHARVSTFGAGCYNGFRSFYEHFPTPPAAFDLSQSTLRLTLTGQHYAVQHIAGAPAFFPEASPDLGLGDDAVTAPIGLPFAVPYPGGTTTQIVVGSNGYVFLQPSTMANAFYGNTGWLLSDAPRLAALWGDLDPGTGAGGGTIHVDIDRTAQAVYVTWRNLQEYGTPSAVSTFQIALFATGVVEYRYQACAIAATPALTGWSPGRGVLDPGSHDLSGGVFQTGDPATAEGPALAHAAATLPGLGGTATLDTSNIPASSPYGATLLGYSSYQPGIELSALGMSGCYLHAAPDLFVPFVPSGGMGRWTLPIPNAPALVGAHLFTQGMAFVSGVNPTGILTSNGVDLRLGYP